MDLVPKDSRYIPLTQQKYCCVPTCIQMVMMRHHLPVVPAELLGYHLGLIVPEEDAALFWQARTGPRPAAGYGTQISKAEFEPNVVFEKLQIPLRLKKRLISEFTDASGVMDYLIKAMAEDKDVLVCFDWGVLYDSNYRGGHVCVVDKVLAETREVRLIDTEYEAPKWRMVDIDKLYQSIVVHGLERSGGFWELV